MPGNKFELIFYLKIPDVICEDGTRALYLLTTVNRPRDIPGSQYRHLVKQSLRCEDR